MRRSALLCLALLTVAGCLPDEAPQGLRPTPAGTGPKVVFDLNARLLPDLPFPNDLLTRPDPASPTGLRLDMPVAVAPSAAERAVREAALTLDGFGTFGPISVRFDAPLDLTALAGRGRAFDNDPVLVLDLTPGATFGERIPLDLGRGHFPLVVADPAAISFPQGPRAGQSNLMFDTVEEDQNGNGVLDPGEDSDADGVLDHPNVLPEGGDPTRDLLTFYERETNTLLLRPVVPLRPGHVYAVALTKAVRGVDGAPIRSPFEYIHHMRQTEALRDLDPALRRHGLDLDAVAFAWTFTTQTATRELTALRAGLYGSGPFGRLTDCFPAGLISNAEPGVQVLRDAALRTALDALFPTAPPADFDAVSHLVLGTIEVPYLLADDDGHGPVVPDAAVVGASCDPAEANDWLRVLPVEGDDDEHFRLDSETGALTAIRAEVPFWCAVPKNGQPAPVVLYGHDVGGSRLDGLRLAGAWARWGLATCAIDAVGHGPVLSAETTAALAALDERGRVFELGRARDLNGDGVLDPGVDTFTPDPLHTRDVIRQSALDWVAFLRVLRSFDGRRRWRSRPVGVSSNLAGDFDDDGRVDFGGPDLPVHVTGEGYGGMLAGIVAAIEPRVTSAAPVSAAGGLVDVSLRSARPGVPQTALLPSFGPLIIGLPDVDRRGQTGTGGVLVTAWVNDLARPAHADPQARVGLPLAKIATLDPGDLVVLTNLNTGERREARVNAAGGFQVAVGAEALMGSARLHRLRYGPQVDVTELGDLLRLEVYTDPKVTLETFRYTVNFQEAVYPNQPAAARLVALTRGWGVPRQTPDFRRFALLMQTLMEPGDPINYARNILLDPAPVDAAGGQPGADLLVIATAGDTHVPIATALSFARAAGVLPIETPAPNRDASADSLLIDRGVAEGLARLRPLVDVDDLSDGALDVAERLDPPLRLTVAGGERGESGLRIAWVDPAGSHGLGHADPTRPWDGHTYLVNLLGQFFATGSTAHRACLAIGTCAEAMP